MKKIMTYLVLLGAFSFIGLGCDYMEADDVCYPSKRIESCRDLDDQLELCDPEAEINVPGCDVGLECDSDGENCTEFCAGDLVPCNTLDQNECNAADNCTWFYDPDNVDRESE